MNVIELHWPDGYRGGKTIMQLPSREGVKSLLEMVGYADVQLEDVYSRPLAAHRAVFTARRPRREVAYMNYGEYPAGAAV
jgi:hypothetical protein